jgi:poly-gamma-glutamate synthesis protein (capsule biosynthesis protein)
MPVPVGIFAKHKCLPFSDRRKDQVIVFGLGSISSGIPAEWAAEENRPGLFLLECMKEDPVKILADNITAIRRVGDLVIASIHWGSNWGYNVSSSDRRFAHRLIDEVGILHGHSSHHVQGIEVYKGI